MTEWVKKQYNAAYTSYVPWLEDKYLAWFGENKTSYTAKGFFFLFCFSFSFLLCFPFFLSLPFCVPHQHHTNQPTTQPTNPPLR